MILRYDSIAGGYVVLGVLIPCVGFCEYRWFNPGCYRSTGLDTSVYRESLGTYEQAELTMYRG